jgi:2-polyprenyl-3-methyl-5-hydroxy-6-metoxy-1,4-benzoquinol methylase
MATRLEALATRLRSSGNGSAGSAGSDGVADTDGSRYGALWQPATEGDARSVILNDEDPERFDESGRGEYGRLSPFIKPDSVVVDVGCGIGRVAQFVAPNCGTLWAVDASSTMLEMARRKMELSTNVKYALCLDTSIPDIADASVDFVYSVLVLQHLEREDAFLLLEEIHRILKPSGRAFITWPNLTQGYGLQSLIDYARSGEKANRSRARIYTTMELETIIPAAGFSEVEVLDDVNIVTICTP